MFSRKKKTPAPVAAPTTNASALALFNKYADPENPFAINAEGISKFADDLEIDPTTDLRILVLLHRMGANSKPGEISQAEWNEGCRKLNVFDIEGFKGLLTRLDPGFMEHKEFKGLFKFVFQFSREGTHKTLERDLVVALLQMVLGSRGNAHCTKFCEFLEGMGEANVRINLDQWTSFLEFSVNINADCAGYDDDENAAWPVLIDEFVDWLRAYKK